MSRRARRGETAFGSDSFLDIVANIVGILIILIVMAGVRASRAPVDPVAEAPPATGGAPLAVEGDAPEGEAVLAAATQTVPDREPPVAPLPEPDPEPQPSPELVQLVLELERDVAADEQDAARAAAELEALSAREREALARLAELERAVTEETSASGEAARRLERLREEVEDARRHVRRVQAELAETERAKTPANTIRHRLTPVSRVVDGKEIHFQLLNGRVAHVPVDELVERLQAQIVRQKDWLARFRRHQGLVGPVRGFSMSYVVERQEMSTLDQLRQGTGYMRIGVAEWRIVPEPELEAETFQEALRQGSNFARALRAADYDATLTFWVYPDSFALFRQLQELAHAEGFIVAARPLPHGVPIAASPKGTRSAGQ